MFLPEQLSPETAPDLRAVLLAAFAAGGPVTVNGHGVVRAGTAALQVLVAASRQAERDGVAFQVQAPSPELREACRDLGLAGWLERWSAR